MRFPPGIGIAVLLIGATVAAHSGALGGTFHYDDAPAVVENPAIRSWQPLFYLTSPLAVSGDINSSGYRPLTVATFAANYAVGRLGPRGYLLVNLLLHFAVSWMVFVGGRRLLGDDRWAAVAALLFAVHPVNAEAVNYVVARSSLLATLGAMAAFWAFVRRQEGGGTGWLVGGLVAFAAALLSKESATALIPPLLASSLVLEGTAARGARATSRPFHEALWFVGLAAIFAAVRMAVVGKEVTGHGAAYPPWAFAEMVGRSLLLWVWPLPLGLNHPLQFVDRFDLPVAATLVVLSIGMAVAVYRSRAPLVLWGAIWILAGFLPLAPLFWMTTRGLFQENRMAFSAVGLAWLTAVGVRASLAVAQSRAGVRLARGGVIVVGGLVLVGAVAMDRARSAVWNDDPRLWEEVVQQSPGDLLARINLGSAYMDQKEFDRAEFEFKRILAIAPNYARAYYNLGLLALHRDRYEEARKMLLHAAALAPQYPEAHHILGAEAFKRKRWDDARAAYERAVALNPRDAKAHAKLGLLSQWAGDLAAAEVSYLASLRDDPKNVEVLNNLGAMYLQRREWLRALGLLTTALQRDPESIEALYNRAAVLVGLRRKDEGFAALRDVLAKLPPDPQFDAYRLGARYLLDGGEP